ncbi:hypothetical protein ACFQY5_20475 [Paeniroseomonas aquatica]|uniref:hypothetical protein n=1 Tax=Paeniroseomonas aquatica TaxID=373043 RepID=UPI00361D39AF
MDRGDQVLSVQHPAEQERGARPDLDHLVHLDVDRQAERGEGIHAEVDRPLQQRLQLGGVAAECALQGVAQHLDGLELGARADAGRRHDMQRAALGRCQAQPVQDGGAVSARHRTRHEHDVAGAYVAEVAALVPGGQRNAGDLAVLEHGGHHGAVDVIPGSADPAEEDDAAEARDVGERIDVADLGSGLRPIDARRLPGRCRILRLEVQPAGVAHRDRGLNEQADVAQDGEAILDPEHRLRRGADADAIPVDEHFDADVAVAVVRGDGNLLFLPPDPADEAVDDQLALLGSDLDVQHDVVVPDEIDAVAALDRDIREGEGQHVAGADMQLPEARISHRFGYDIGQDTAPSKDRSSIMRR